MVHLHTAWEIPPPPISLHAPVLSFQRIAAVRKTMKEQSIQEYLHQEHKIRPQQGIFSPIYAGQVLMHIYTHIYIYICTNTRTQRILKEERIFFLICILAIIKAQITLSQILLEMTRCSSSTPNSKMIIASTQLLYW